ncbi:hypothetical protein [Erythrobacter sp. EC-HK427]|nr:hypothetical protein [Erythrobacter sp. EC-HK427]
MATSAAFASFTAMDSFADASPTQNALHIAGYFFVAIALYLFFKGLRTQQ